MLANILCIGAVLLFGLMLTSCKSDNGNSNGSGSGNGEEVACDSTNTSMDCSCSDRKLIDNTDGDCDGDGVENGTDVFQRNACATTDTDGDGFPDDVSSPLRGQPCDNADASSLVTTLNAKPNANRIIPGCATSFSMCADRDDDNDGFRDENDDFSKNAWRRHQHR